MEENIKRVRGKYPKAYCLRMLSGGFRVYENDSWDINVRMLGFGETAEEAWSNAALVL
jgi:hypothetical protein